MTPLRVAEIWRFPVKSLLGERLEQAEVGPEGVGEGNSGTLPRDVRHV